MSLKNDCHTIYGAVIVFVLLLMPLVRVLKVSHKVARALNLSLQYE
jgi:hypothetical protein